MVLCQNRATMYSGHWSENVKFLFAKKVKNTFFLWAFLLALSVTFISLLSASTSSWATVPAGMQDWWVGKLPAWVPRPKEPAHNVMTAAKVELGRHLFYDKRLSANQEMACATCHLQEKAFTDGNAVSKGVTLEAGARSAMPLANVAYMSVLTWANPNIQSLETQALIPLFGEHPIEMGMAGREQALMQFFATDKTYQVLFNQAFPQLSIMAKKDKNALYNLATMTQAIASFERSLLSFNSPYDQFKYGGKINAISESAKRGEDLFFGEKLECYHCHGGFNFTDNSNHQKLSFPEQGFHNTGLYNLDGKGAYPSHNIGIAEFTGQPLDMGKFRTPSLRNIALTAPYMHDGSIASLEQVLTQHYALAGKASASPNGTSPIKNETLVGFELTAQELKDIVAFLNTLTDTQFIQNKAHSDPWKK